MPAGKKTHTIKMISKKSPVLTDEFDLFSK